MVLMIVQTWALSILFHRNQNNNKIQFTRTRTIPNNTATETISTTKTYVTVFSVFTAVAVIVSATLFVDGWLHCILLVPCLYNSCFRERKKRRRKDDSLFPDLSVYAQESLFDEVKIADNIGNKRAGSIDLRRNNWKNDKKSTHKIMNITPSSSDNRLFILFERLWKPWSNYQTRS